MKKQTTLQTTRRGHQLAGAGTLALLSLSGQAMADPSGHRCDRAQPGWVAGDFHQHSTYTDGSYSIAEVHRANAYYGLDWWANSEHGGGFNRNARLSGLDLAATVYWDQTPGVTILGDSSTSGGHRNMWRWQSIRDFSFQDVLTARSLYPDKTIIQGLEWNVPGHEHCSVGIIDNQFGKMVLNANPVAEFEYKFDNSDKDLTGGAAQGWVKSAKSGHEKAIEAVSWLQTNYGKTSWAVPAHPERYIYNGSTGYNINHFRDLNNAAPDVFFGFESMPGHQKSDDRGEYRYSRPSVGSVTYGGCGAFSAKVGGLWDALLGEGRHFWLFANSDFHSDLGADYWPGQYQKTHTYVADKKNPQAIVDGLRSGNSFVAQADLIDGLGFSAQYGSEKATMGESLAVNPKHGRGNPVKVTIRFKSPAANHAPAGIDNVPVVDHIDLIAGSVSGKVQPLLADGVTANPAYTDAANPSSAVIARFTSADWKTDKDGWNVVHCFLRTEGDAYLRLRGTNREIGVDTGDIDANGEPLPDGMLAATDIDDTVKGDAEAWTDLWFYSNPIFISVGDRR